MRKLLTTTALVCALLSFLHVPAHAREGTGNADPVVVATLDTGTNPFHPCFRRDVDSLKALRHKIREYPSDAKSLRLRFEKTYSRSLEASSPALGAIRPETLYYVPGTNLSFYGVGPNAKTQLVDDDPHGAHASSQIACQKYGMAPNAHLVVLNAYDEGTDIAHLFKWVIRQEWIDVVHVNFQDPIALAAVTNDNTGLMDLLIGSGKMVVVAGGNGVMGAGAMYPTELGSWSVSAGSLIAGANDNGGYATYSNLNPHVVMDGGATVSAQADGFGDAPFSGTSSSSPRLAGYVTKIIADLRAQFGHAGQGLVSIPSKRRAPSRGPLSDRTLTASELHEVVRKTADPNPHDSRYDGGTMYEFWIPQPAPLESAFYPKMGYGEVSEHTIGAAINVATGKTQMPSRPEEDRAYEESEARRRQVRDLI